MRRSDRRLLPALTLMAAIAQFLRFRVSLSPLQAPSLLKQRQTRYRSNHHQQLPLPATPPTAEQIGDALMAHQRYQAAIEAYKKAPT